MKDAEDISREVLRLRVEIEELRRYYKKMSQFYGDVVNQTEVENSNIND